MRIKQKISDWWCDFIISQLYVPLRYKKRVKLSSRSFFVYRDGSVVYKKSFITYCEKNRMNWPEECYKEYEELRLNEPS